MNSASLLRLSVVALWLVNAPVQAGMFDSLNLGGAASNLTSAASSLTGSTNQAGAAASLAALTPDQMTGGLKEALGKGLQHAVSTLGHDGGFLTNIAVKIPLPGQLASAEKALRAAGQNQLADEFVATMNHAAEQAVPEAASLFGDAVQQMSITDAQAILTGPQDAATQYFRRTTETNLYNHFLPIVQNATASNGVTAAYKNMMAKVANLPTDSNSMLGKVANTSFGGMSLGGMASSKLNPDTLDLDAYVTRKSLDGLFKMVAVEEASIRQNPVARTSDLLQKVFGAAASSP